LAIGSGESVENRHGQAGGAGSQSAARTMEGVPRLWPRALEKQDLCLASFGPVPHQTSRKDAAAIDDQEVAPAQQGGKVLEGAVLGAAGSPVEDEQARGIALGARLLGNQLRGEVVLEVGDLQNSFFCGVVGGTRPKCW
jgi:hypothetical protein